jgi:biofilm PGA synthesis N-glycosyltransferase PgaC
VGTWAGVGRGAPTTTTHRPHAGVPAAGHHRLVSDAANARAAALHGGAPVSPPSRESLFPAPRKPGRRPSHESVLAVGRATPKGRLIVVIPAHNEAAGIRGAVDALQNQTYRPSRVVVVADNCIDKTAKLAYWAGAQVLVTKNNSHKKAGALNQVFADLLPQMADHDMVMVVDADSELDPDFLNYAVAKLNADPKMGAVGGIFRGGAGGGLVGLLQRNEYARYARDVARLNGKCLVVTGTAALFRVATLKAVSRGRIAGILPAGDGMGGVYDTSVLTEDNELTFALLHLGYKVLSPKECTLVTEVMPTWRALWKQRERWKRGAIENCVQYGLTRITWRYWGRQLFTMLGVLVTFAYLGTLIYAAAVGGFQLRPLWVLVTAVFVLERVVTLRYRGWKHMLLAATMYELVLDMFLQFVHAKAFTDALLHRERKW